MRRRREARVQRGAVPAAAVGASPPSPRRPAGLNRYPDDAAVALREALAGRYGVDAEQVLPGNGSVELCRMALAATCDPGDEVVFAWPSFEAYPILAQQVGATIVHGPAPRRTVTTSTPWPTRSPSAPGSCSCATPTTRPAPTVDRDAVERFLERVPDDLLVVFDEAYREFVTTPDFPDGLDLLRDHANVAVLRTFSKAYGLAALRVGYAIARPDVIDALRKVRVPFEGERARAGRGVGVARGATTRCGRASTR